MEMTKQEAIQALRQSNALFVAYSQATKLPYVTCDEESFNDQAWIFDTEAGLKAFGEEKLKEKIALMGMKYEKKNLPMLYGILYSIGVNSVVLHKGQKKLEVELSDIAKQPDFSKLEPARRPFTNPTLQLCGLYFMQELRRPVKPEERKDMREMESELLANIVKSEYLIALGADEKDPKKVTFPYLKNKDGKTMQPVFSDGMEYEKFARGKKVRPAKVTLQKMYEMLLPQSEGIVLNPLGFNLFLNKDQMKRILGIREPKDA